MRSIARMFTAGLLALPAAAFAEGVECRPVSGRGPILTLVVLDGPAGALAPTLQVGKRLLDVEIARSLIDDRHFWIDLTDLGGDRVQAQLRATFRKEAEAQPAIGTLYRGKRRYEVRCTEI